MKMLAPKYEIYRRPLYGDYGDAYNGMLDGVPVSSGRVRIVFSDGGGWDHVSVSMPDRCPTWEDMSYVKAMFWNDSDCVVQYHPPKVLYRNVHNCCLHLWKPQHETLPMPNPDMVALV